MVVLSLAAAGAVCGPPAGTAARAADWSHGARLGFEVEGSREAFGPGALFDARYDPAGPTGTDDPPTPDESILVGRFTDRSTQWSGLGEARLEGTGVFTLRSRAMLRVARRRTRGDLEVETGGPTRAGRFAATGRFFFQAGLEGGGAGRTVAANASWAAPKLPADLELRLAAAAERSWAGADTLRRIFDYRRASPSAELRRRLGWSGDLSLRGGLGRKTTGADEVGAYRERWAEAEWTRFAGAGLRSDLRLRSESRRYGRNETVLPSYDQVSVEGEAGFPVLGRTRLRISPTLARTAYASDDSLVFRDHWSAECVLRLESVLGGDEADVPDAWAGAEEGWRAYAGTRVGLLRNERVRDADYRTASFLLGCSRDATASWWLDLTGEVGRRDYRGTGAGGALVFEGYDVSVNGTDYTFVSSSLLGQGALGRAFRLELFVLWDRELHRAEADDFSLWACTASLTRSF